MDLATTTACRAIVGVLLTAGLSVSGHSIAGADDGQIGCGTETAEVSIDPQSRGLIDLASHDPDRLEGFFVLDRPLAPGDYELFTVAADDHFGPDWYQATEQYRMSLGGVRSPGVTEDIPTESAWFNGEFHPDDDDDLTTMPAAVAAGLPGFSLGVVTIDEPTSQVGFHHVWADGIGNPAEVNSITPASATIRCVAEVLSPALTPSLLLDKRVDGRDSDEESSDVEAIEIGVPFVWMVELLNAGGAPATGIVLRDEMPPGVRILVDQVVSDRGPVRVDGSTATWEGALDPGQRVVMRVPAIIESVEAFLVCLNEDLDPGNELCTNRAEVVDFDQLPSSFTVGKAPAASSSILVPDRDVLLAEDLVPATTSSLSTGESDPSAGTDALPPPSPSAPAAPVEPGSVQPSELAGEPPTEAPRSDRPSQGAYEETSGTDGPGLSGTLPFTGPFDSTDTVGFGAGLIAIGCAFVRGSARSRRR